LAGAAAYSAAAGHAGSAFVGAAGTALAVIWEVPAKNLRLCAAPALFLGGFGDFQPQKSAFPSERQINACQWGDDARDEVPSKNLCKFNLTTSPL
jgi:hypothetical protein